MTDSDFYRSETFMTSISTGGASRSAAVRRRRADLRAELAAGAKPLRDLIGDPCLKRERIASLLACLPGFDESRAEAMCAAYGVDARRCTVAACGRRRLPDMVRDADELSRLLARGDYGARRERAMRDVASGALPLEAALANPYLKRDEAASIIGLAGVERPESVLASAGLDGGVRAIFLTPAGRAEVARLARALGGGSDE